jgi:hypothetical protein
MLTAGTRAQVLGMIQRHRRADSVLMIATDGVFSTERLQIDENVRLGGWERSEHASITLVRPGIYWTGEGKLRARGMGRDTLDSAQTLLEAGLKSGAETVQCPPRTAFGGARLTVYATRDAEIRRSRHYGQWHEIPTRVSLAPGPKRAADWSPPRLSGVESAPYGSKSTAKVAGLFDILAEIRENTL